MKISIFKLYIITLFVVSCSCNKKKQIGYEEVGLNDDPKTESIVRGKEVYHTHCIQCHLPSGKGSPKMIPPLVSSDWLKEKRTASIHAIKFGLKDEIIVNGSSYKGVMPIQFLNPAQIADVMNYILNSWGNSSDKMVTVEEVEIVKK